MNNYMKLRQLRGGGRLSVDSSEIKRRLNEYALHARVINSWRKADRLALYVVCLCDRYGRTQEEAADIIGISRPYAGMLYRRKKALEKDIATFKDELEALDAYIIYIARYVRHY